MKRWLLRLLGVKFPTDTMHVRMEVLRCIYCARTMQWPIDRLWPDHCPYCRGWRGMTSASRAHEQE